MDAAARTGLVEKHLGYVHWLARRIHAMVGGAAPLDELIASGRQGLAEAAERFDPSLGARFLTFAHYRIRGAIYDGMRASSWLPRTELDRIKALRRIESYLEHLGERADAARVPGAPAAAADLGAGAAASLRAMYDAFRATATIYVTSLEDSGPDGELALVTDADDSPEDATAREQISALVRREVAELPERERLVIEKCYFEDKSLTEAGAELGLSRSWSCRLHARAVERLRKRLRERARLDEP